MDDFGPFLNSLYYCLMSMNAITVRVLYLLRVVRARWLVRTCACGRRPGGGAKGTGSSQGARTPRAPGAGAGAGASASAADASGAACGSTRCDLRPRTGAAPRRSLTLYCDFPNRNQLFTVSANRELERHHRDVTVAKYKLPIGWKRNS